MTSKNKNCLTKNNDKGNNNDNDNDDSLLLPKMYSTIDEMMRINTNGHDDVCYNNDSTLPATDTTNENQLLPPHLFLHFDVNETILLGDPAGGDSVHECINKIIAKSAFVSTSRMWNDRHHQQQQQQQQVDTDDDTTTKLLIKRTPSSGNICDTHQFEPTHWWNGVLINDTNDYSTTTPPPPLYTGWTIPPDTCPYYRTKYKDHAKTFTSSPHGQVYRPLYDKLCIKLGLDCTTDHDGRGGGSNDVLQQQQQQQQQPNEEEEMRSVFQNFLPAFWSTLVYYFPSSTNKTNVSNSNNIEEAASPTTATVVSEGRRGGLPPPHKVTLVLRTFGTDLPRVAKAISQFAKGNHPDYPNYSNEDLILEEGDLYCSGWSYHNHGKKEEEEEEELVYSLHRSTKNDNYDQEEGEETPPPAVYSGDDDILNFLRSKHIVGIQDNYPFWRDNNHAPWAGKPVWSNTSVHGHHHHHVLLDDNIHNDPSDGAGGIRVPVVVENGEGGGGGGDSNNNCYNRYESLHGDKALDLHGRHLIRVPTIRPSLEDDWFIRQIEMARWLVKSGQVKPND